MTPPLTRKKLHLEGLRGIAALVVYFAHFRPTFCVNIEKNIFSATGITTKSGELIAGNFTSLLFSGELPVFIFWFMSAYVISIRLFGPRNADNSYLTEASTKRYFRLAIPVFFSSLICYLLLSAGAIQNQSLAHSLGSGYADGWLGEWYTFEPNFFNFLRTTLVETFLPGNCSYNIVLWTMNPELLGSFLCFAIFALMGRMPMRYYLYISLLLFLFLGGIRSHTYFNYFVFVAGILWCDLDYSDEKNLPWKNRLQTIFKSRLTPLLLLLFSYGATIYSDVVRPIPENAYIFFQFALRAIGFTLLVNNFGILRALFSTKLFTWLGKISFSFYLLHIPVLFSLGPYLYFHLPATMNHRLALIFFAVLFVTIGAAYVFMRLVDAKSITISNRIGKDFVKRNARADSGSI